ncbi:MAG: metal-binding protein [Methylomonas sp.]|nr:metal-binding protein [Methylomonas sp.]PPD20869.1 MAG: metal-binding protein [Methylomonas sp.]PPD26342.1 MAG: metal-binding protein [Methylomonas sp.]PPD38063.1 MAG: metal-binding protein [Methylomonas sp.]PPD40300.1 MAG: metal-binding protein [Methylomonas sp.]
MNRLSFFTTKPVDHACDLCGQPVKVPGFELPVPQASGKKFCCAGCLSIYQLLNPETITNDNKTENLS